MSSTRELTVTAADGLISISVGIDHLEKACADAIGDFRISNKADAVKAVVAALNREKDDGTTLVHEMFDQALNDAIESGDEGFEEVDPNADEDDED